MRAALLFVAFLAPAVAAAQDTAIVIHPESAGVHLAPPELPRLVAEEVIRLYNAPTTTRLVGRSRLPHGNEWRGDVAVRNGPVVIAGRVQGDLLVVNGDVVLEAGSEVTGTVLVVGGTVARAADARVGGEVREYREPLAYRLEGDALVYAPNLRKRFRNPTAQYAFGSADSRSALTLSTGGTFNRVEGLPIVFGPVFDWRLRGNTRLKVDALGVFRTAGDLSNTRGDLGYLVRAELRTGEPAWGIGLRALDVIAPVEDWGLHSSEVGWAAWLFQRDYRDYFTNKGFGVRAFAQPGRPLTLSVEWRRERQQSVEAEDPWTVFRNDQAWRPNPPIDEGRYVTFAAGVTFDTRNDHTDPTSGWYLRGTLEHSRSKDVQPQVGVPGSVRDSIPTDGSYRFTRAWLDFRRYARVSPGGRLNLRLLTGGWLGGDPLPLQRRLSIGGPEPLPGYSFRHGSCSERITDPAFAGTRLAACDRVFLLQAEYRGHISLRWAYPSNQGTDDEGRGASTLIQLEGPDLVVFGNAGQGWLVGTGPGRLPSSKLPGLDSWLADLGLGVDWGGFGMYIAKAVTVGQPLRFTLRLDHRF
jgi:hypothetical protein